MALKNNPISRRKFFKYGGAAIGAVAAANLIGTATKAQSPNSFLIKNATIMTMDDELGEITSGDVLIRNGIIVEVGTNISASVDEVIDGKGQIVLPGFVDGHRHLFQTAMRGRHDIFGYGNYSKEMINRHSPSYSPEDIEISNYMGGLEALNAGVTSVVDYYHNTITPDHSEAAIRGMLKAGVGGTFCYGIAGVPAHGPGDTVKFGQPRPHRHSEKYLDHARSMKAKHFSDKDASLKFGVCTSMFELYSKNTDQIIEQMAAANSLESDLVTIHVHNNDPKAFRIVPFMVENDLCAPNVLLAHANGVTLEEMKSISDLGVSICVTPETEIAYGEKLAFGRAAEAGVDISLGADTVIFNGGDMFSAMRMTLQVQRYTEAPAWDLDKSSHITHPMSVLKAATIEGARAIGRGDEVGSISVGKHADIIMIDTKAIHFQPMTFPLAAVIFDATVHDVKNVWVKGKAVKRDGKLTIDDYEDSKKKLISSMEGIVKKANSITFK